jgi:hypothetical protein
MKDYYCCIALKHTAQSYSQVIRNEDGNINIYLTPELAICVYYCPFCGKKLNDE